MPASQPAMIPTPGAAVFVRTGLEPSDDGHSDGLSKSCDRLCRGGEYFLIWPYGVEREVHEESSRRAECGRTC